MKRRRRASYRLQGALIGSVFTSLVGLAAIGSFAPERLEIPENFDGVSSEGVPVPPPAILPDGGSAEFKPLQTRLGGKWGNPGYRPFNGDIYSALRLMGLPGAEAVELTHRIKAHASEGEIMFSNSGVRDREGVYKFSRYYAMTFGNTLSYATKTNFKGDEIQRAERYTVMLDGKPVVFAVPYVCGNVTRLNVLPDEELTASAVRSGEPLVSDDKVAYNRGYIDGYRSAVELMTGKDEGDEQVKVAARVSEPGTWAMMLMGLAWLAHGLRFRMNRPALLSLSKRALRQQTAWRAGKFARRGLPGYSECLWNGATRRNVSQRRQGGLDVRSLVPAV